MKVVIDIPENDYKLACNYPDALIACYAHYIKAGVPLPKNHGRLIDANDVTERIRQRLGIRNIDYLLESEKPIAMSIDSSPTVIEAEE